MITEEAIKQTRFFRRVDEKIYLVADTRKVILATLIDTIEGTESQVLLGDEVCAEFAPVLADFQPFIQNQVFDDRPVEQKPNEPKNETAKTKGRHGVARRKDSSSQFRGVREDKRGYRDGRRKWVVNFYNKDKGKVEYIGTFDNEFLAAAVYEERTGNKQEAKRLRALVKEYQELNSDKPLDGVGRHEIKRSGKSIWVCKRCGLEYQSKGICAGCGNDDMREVKGNA